MQITLSDTIETFVIVANKADAVKVTSGDGALLSDVKRDDGQHQRWRFEKDSVVTVPQHIGEKLVETKHATAKK